MASEVTPEGARGQFVLGAGNRTGPSELWWPNGMGKQPLYRLELKLTKNDTQLDLLAADLAFERCS